jgi:hypothetical protein
MDRAEVIRQMIAEKQRQIELFEAMIAEWEKELGQSSSGRVTDKGDEQVTKIKPTPMSGDIVALVRNFQFFNHTQTEAAKSLLELVGHPLTTDEIMAGIEKGGVKLGGKTPKDKKQNFYTILNRSKEFGRAARNTWGLVSWPGITKDEKDETDESNGKDKTPEAEK